MVYIGIIVAIIIVTCVLELQRRSFISTRKQIIELSNFFPKIQTLSIINSMVNTFQINNKEVLNKYVLAPKNRDDIMNSLADEDQHLIDEYVDVSLIMYKDQKASTRFCDIIKKTNVYLCKNTGTSADFDQLKEICENQLNALDNSIHNSLNVPLYLGLAGTFIGIITGLFGIDFNSIFTGDEADFTGLQHLLYGVICAMVASLVGLSLTIYNTAIAYKRATNSIDSQKEEYYDFLRREIMPVLANSMSSSLNSLRGVLGHFVDKFGRNLDAYSESAELLNDNLEKQHLVLQQLNQLSLTRTANKIAETFVTLKDSSDSLNVFKSYQNSLNTTIANMGTTTQNIDKLFIQFDTMRKGLEAIVENQSTTNDLQRQFKLAIEENFPAGGEVRNSWRKEFDTLIEDAKTATSSLSDQLKQNTQYISNFVNQNNDFFSSFDKLNDVLTSMVQYTDVQAKCYTDLKSEIASMRNDYKETQQIATTTNNAVLEAVKEMTKAIKDLKSASHGN